MNGGTTAIDRDEDWRLMGRDLGEAPIPTRT